MITKNTVTCHSLEELINIIYTQLGEMGLYFHLANGEVDVEEIMFNIESPLPNSYPCTVTIKCEYEVDVDIYIEVIND